MWSRGSQKTYKQYDVLNHDQAIVMGSEPMQESEADWARQRCLGEKDNDNFLGSYENFLQQQTNSTKKQENGKISGSACVVSWVGDPRSAS